jgi:predicted kinase
VDLRDQDAARILASLAPLPSPCPRPALVVVSGLPGSGKSTVADALRRRVQAAVLQSDRLRKLLVATPQYTTEESGRLFAAIHLALERLLAAGIPAILDATTLTERERRPLADIAARTGARFILVWVTASDAVIRRRLAARAAGARAAYDLSDAGVEVYELMRARVEPIAGDHVTIATDGDYLPAVEALARTVAAPAPAPAAGEGL